MAPLIETDHLAFSYTQTGKKPVPILRSISLKIEEGEYVAILGRNGSGKTTLARHLNGLLVPTTGTVRVAGQDTRDPAGLGRVRALVGMVFQYPEDQIVATTVEEDVAFGPENLGLPSREIKERVEDALRQVGMWQDRDRPPYLLSAGQMQRVALAGALAVRPRAIVFDEATAMLDPAGRQTALAIMDRLNREGLTVITITHSMVEASLAKRVIVMQKGEVVLDGPPETIFANEGRLAELGLELPPPARIARVLADRLPGLPKNLLTSKGLLEALTAATGPILPPENPSLPMPPETAGDGFIRVENLGHIYRSGTPLAHRALEGVYLAIPEGHSHGLIGATGSGKSTVLQHLNGLLLPQEGTVKVGPYLLNDPKVDLRQVRSMAGLVMQIPETQFFEQYLVDEIAFGPLALGRSATLREDILSAMEMVGLDFETFKDRQTFTLSGGERRKLALASILAIHPRILLLDEPFLGLDPASHQELLRRFKAMQSEGLMLVLSSHNMVDLAELSETLTVMHAGTSITSGPVSEVFSQEKMLRENGLEPPLVTQVSRILRSHGWPLPARILTVEDLSRALSGVTHRE